jgi:hypothetical protein
MTTLLKRLSVSINEKMGLRDESATPKTLASSTSFNDFSLHVGHEGEDPAALGPVLGVKGWQPLKGRNSALALPPLSVQLTSITRRTPPQRL